MILLKLLILNETQAQVEMKTPEKNANHSPISMTGKENTRPKKHVDG